MREYILSFCREFEYPGEATQALVSAYDVIKNNTEANELFQGQIELYSSDTLTDYNMALSQTERASRLAKVHTYTAQLLLFICFSKRTRELYEKRGIAYDVFYDSMSDLKWKLFECHKVYGIWGSFVAWWFDRFFTLTRFAFGRLQFETVKFYRTYSKNGHTLNPDDIVINIHIPSSGPLKHEDCIASYQKAAEFYKDIFPDRPVAFFCSSWLLYPKHYEFLPKTSNILTFMNDFDIFESNTDEKNGCLWRIFDTMETGCIEKLPNDTSLRRAYIDWLSKGNPCGSGDGIFFYAV